MVFSWRFRGVIELEKSPVVPQMSLVLTKTVHFETKRLVFQNQVLIKKVEKLSGACAASNEAWGPKPLFIEKVVEPPFTPNAD